tara:strand:- start:323 stop:1387 length:1065 start_codon:yes stop_codon:yes gene_type:complete
MEAIEQTWNGNSTAGGTRCTATISRNGDLVGRMYLQLNLTSASGSVVENPGHTIIDSVELEIGGQSIDKHYGHWMEVWAQLTQPNDGAVIGTFAAPTKTGTKFQNMACAGGVLKANGVSKSIAYVPLQFWFCRNPGLSLPLIALQYHEVNIILTLGSAVDAASNKGVKVNSNKLFCDYIYLDTDERRRFAQVSHEYLIEQLQYKSESTGGNIELNFNHPVKELIWTGEYTSTSCSFANFTLTHTANLKLNGHDRFASRPLDYFTKTQVWQHHTGTPVVLKTGYSAGTGKQSCDNIAVYSFALKPEEHQPSGTCNFSRIDNAQLVQSNATACEIYAVNYNVLRIMSGMGGLAYSN